MKNQPYIVCGKLLGRDFSANKLPLGSLLNYTIPQYFVTSPGTLADDVDSAARWNPIHRGTFEDNIIENRVGAASVKITSASGASGYGDLEFKTPIVGLRNIKIVFYLHSSLVNYSATKSIELFVGINASFTKSFRNVDVPYEFVPGWNTIIIDKDCFITTNGASFTDTFTHMRLSLWPVDGQIVVATIDSIYFNTDLKPAIMLSFDAARESIYDNAYNYLKTKNIRATCYVRNAVVGNAGYMTAQEITELYNEDWGIGFYSDVGTDMTSRTYEDTLADIIASKAALEANGWTKDSESMSWPNGVVNETTMLAASNAGVLTSRASTFTDNNSSVKYINNYPDNNLNIKSAINIDTATVASLKTLVDKIVEKKTMISVYSHYVTVDGSLGSSLANFIEFVDYAKAQGVVFVTINDFRSAQSGIIHVPR